MSPVDQPRVHTITPTHAQSLLSAGQATLIDVREPGEHASERIAGAHLVPLSCFDASKVAEVLGPGTRLILHCKGGKRSADAAGRAASLAERGVEVYSMEGGIEAWKQAGLAVLSAASAPRISIMRQVQISVGALVLGGSLLAWFVDPRFVALPAFLGAGLLFAGATGTCALASILGAMPWNKAASCGPACNTGTCTVKP